MNTQKVPMRLSLVLVGLALVTSTKRIPPYKGVATTMDVCQQAAAIIKSRDFRQWQGVPPECTINDLFPELPPLDPDPPLAYFGSNFHPYAFRMMPLEGYWKFCLNHSPEYVLFEGQFPELSTTLNELLTVLGEPTAKLDVQFGAYMPFESDFSVAERINWVWPKRGISMYLYADSTSPEYIYLFRGTTLSDYQAHIQADHKVRMFRPSPMDTPPERIEELDQWEREHAAQ